MKEKYTDIIKKIDIDVARINEKLVPMETQMVRLQMEEDSLYDIINDAEKRLKELKLALHSKRAHGNSKKVYKSIGLCDEVYSLKKEKKILEDFRKTYTDTV
jgi:hypothetical protein